MKLNIRKSIVWVICAVIFIVTAISFGYFVFAGKYVLTEPMMDLEYKKSIIKDSHNIFYKLENLRPIVGEEELTEFIKSNNNNPEIYTPSPDNIKQGVFRANFHMHTLQSDGKASVKQRLDDAQKYAQEHIKDGYMYIAITDHNTVLGAKEVVRLLQKHPGKYKNIKIIPGMEVFTQFRSKYSKNPVEIHVLTWCINPYDKFLNKEFYKAFNANKWNRGKKDRDFDDVIKMMSKYSIPVVAHPVRYTTRIKGNKYLYMNEMLDKYSKLSNKPLVIEGYYQAYPRYYSPEMYKRIVIPFNNYINQKAAELGILRTGSTDSHSKTIFD